MPKTVLKAQANSMILAIFLCGDSKTVLEVWRWRLETASTCGKMQVEIITASICTAISRTVHTANAINKP
jgi:hypothetical protein